MIIDLKDISLFFGSEQILSNICLKIEDKDRIGLIGANGAGKSTLLNIITGELTKSDGEIHRSNKTIGYLHQNSGLSSGNTIFEEMKLVFSDLIDIGEKLSVLYNEISTMTDHNSTQYKDLERQYSHLQTEFEQKEGYSIDIKINSMLNGMGFLNKDNDTKIDTLSGGEKTRLALCKLLLSEPDLLILDEPTNHLDFKTLNWLEDYLKSYKGALLMVSHDRYFLDKLVTDICEIYKTKLARYKGNYTKFVATKEATFKTLEKEYGKLQNEIASLKEYVAKNMARASTSKSAKSRQNTLDKMEIIDRPSDYLKSIKLNFDVRMESGFDVLNIENLKLEIGDKVLNENINFQVFKYDKIAFVGENGIGKTTFLKTILSENEKVVWGRNTTKSYFEQETKTLNHGKTVLNELCDLFPTAYEIDIRNALGKMLLTGDDVHKQIDVLSGGEKSKVKFAIMMLQKANVLILDEPTNHLDLNSKDILDKALAEYEGTIIMVSHDRYLLNKVPTKIVEMTKNGFVIYDGNYDYYLENKQESVVQKAEQTNKENSFYRSKKHRASVVKRANDIKKNEEQISILETEISSLEIEITEIVSDFVLLTEKCNLLEEKKHQLDSLYEVWESLQKDD
jgi:ATP-binding cassette subfamily F protein 3